MDKRIESVQGQIEQTAEVSRSWLQLPIHVYIKALVVGVLFVLLFNQEIGSLIYRWQGDSSWSHGFIIPLFSLYFLHHRRNQILALETGPDYIGLFFMLVSIAFYALNLSVPSLHFGYASPLLMLCVLASVVLFLGGRQLLKLTALPIFFLFFAVPLPQGYYFSITMPMRVLAARVSVALLNLVSGVDATVSGVIIEVVYKGQKVEPAIDVAEACSGMRLLMAFVALGVAMAYIYQRPLWQKLVLIAATIPIAIFCNVVRVVITGFIYVFINQQLAQGVYHDLLGLAMLLLAFGLYGLLDWFMSKLFIDEDNVVKEDVIIRKPRYPNSSGTDKQQ